MKLLSTPKDNKGYVEELIILDKTKGIYKFSLSNNLEDIEIAIFDRTGYEIDLNTAYWRLNNDLSIIVKHLMNKHNVNYGMTICENNKKSIIINVRANGQWFITGYDEYKSNYINWETMEKARLLQEYIKYINSEDDADIE